MDHIVKSNFLYSRVDKEAEDFLHHVLELGIKFTKGEVLEDKCLNYASIDELKDIVSQQLPQQGCDYDDILTHLQDVVLKYSISQASPSYLSFPDTGNSVAGFAADIITAFSNQNLIAVDRSAPIGTFIEMQLIMWLRGLIGYSSCEISDLNCLNEVGGMWTSGGNMSNYVSVLTALNHAFPSIKKEGLQSLDQAPAVVLTKGIQHFSFAGAAASLGIGEDNLLWCDTDENYTSSIEHMEQTILNCPDDKKIFMLVCVAGNCRTTNIDNIRAARALCDKYGLWLHVDACHGGTLLFSENKCRLDGIDLADSVSLDPHKGLFVTYPSSYVLFKDPRVLSMYSRYPGHETNPNIMDMGLIMPFFGSRGFHSLKLWLLIKKIGYEGLCTLIEKRNQLNKKMSAYLDQTGYFCLLNQNEFYRQAMVFYPKSLRPLVEKLSPKEAIKIISQFTEVFSQTLYEGGQVCLDSFSLVDYSNAVGFGEEKYNTIGVAIGHPEIEDEKIGFIIKTISQTAQRVEKEMRLVLEGSLAQETTDQAKSISPASW